MTDIRTLLNILTEAEAAAQTPPAPTQLLLLVHPGSCCGSANFNIGRQLASGYRECIARTLSGWHGAILVLDGELSDELSDYPMFQSAISAALERSHSAGLPALRISACAMNNDDWVERGLEAVKKIVPSGAKVEITGAWTQRDNHGCCDAMWYALDRAGFHPDILDCAMKLDGDDGDEDYEEDEED